MRHADTYIEVTSDITLPGQQSRPNITLNDECCSVSDPHTKSKVLLPKKLHTTPSLLEISVADHARVLL